MKQMKKSVEVDVYGKCGKLKCDRSDEAGCYTQLENNYRFYLSFENSVCEVELETKDKRRLTRGGEGSDQVWNFPHFF